MTINLSAIPQGFVGNASTVDAPPAALTPQQAAEMIAPYISGGGSSAGPWMNASNPGNGLAPIVSGQDATAALQSQIDWLFTTYTSGMIVMPPGEFPISSTLHIKGGVTLWGAGIRATSIVVSSDITAIALDASVSYGGFRDLWVKCYLSSEATQNGVYVDTNVAAIIRDAWIWGGNWALDTKGVDGLYENLYLNGYGPAGGGIKSTGANWYIRNKIDCWPQAVNVAFYQGISGGTGVAENHLTQCDLTGNYQISLYIEDGGANTAVTTITDSVFGSKISIPHHRATILNGNEIGDTFLYVGNGDLVATGNVAFGNTTITGPGAKTLAGNLRLN